MNELNLVKILKDCPKGTILYSTTHGVVSLQNVEQEEYREYPITLHKLIPNPNPIRGDYFLIEISLTAEGKIYPAPNDAECQLFPSKYNRDWSMFNNKLCSMTLKEAKAWMLSHPGQKVICPYFHDEWILFDGSRFVFEDGVEPDAYWWNKANGFDCKWAVLKE